MPSPSTAPAFSDNCWAVRTEEALAYLEDRGGSVHQEETLAIPSQFSTGYPLANGEVVVLENGLRDESLALVFATRAAFTACCRADFFPLPAPYLTWPEAHFAEVAHFLSNPDVYAGPLRTAVQVELPFATVAAFEAAFARVGTYLRKTSLTWETREPVAHAFAWATAQFCVAHWGFACELRRYYTDFNPCYEPCLRQIINGRDGAASVLGSVLLVAKPRHKAQFDEFLWWVTGIPPVQQADRLPKKE